MIAIQTVDIPYSRLFSRGKVFTNWPYPTFSRENFHKHLSVPINFSTAVQSALIQLQHPVRTHPK